MMRTVVSSIRTDASSCDVAEHQVQIDAKRCDIGPKPMRVDAILCRFEVDTNLSKTSSDPCASRFEIGASIRIGSRGSSVLVVSCYCSFLMMVRWCPSGVPVLFQCARRCPDNVWVVSWWCPGGVRVMSQWCHSVVSMVSR